MRCNMMKLLAIVLATVFLLAAVTCGVGMIYIAEFDLYESEEAAGDSFLEQMTYRMAWDYAQIAIGKQTGGLEEDEVFLLKSHNLPDLVKDRVDEIRMGYTDLKNKDIIYFKHAVSDLLYPVVLEEGEEYPDRDYLYAETHRVWTDGCYRNYTVLYYSLDMMGLPVTVFWQKTDSPWLTVASACYAIRAYLLPLMLLFLALFAVCMVYLCWVAGKKTGREEIRPGGLNRLPLDLYALADCVVGFHCLLLLFEGVPALIAEEYAHLALIYALLAIFMVCLICVCYVFCFAAQVKAKGFWWRRSVIGWCCLRLLRVLHWCWRGLKAVFAMLPVIWQWLATAAAMVLLVTVTTLLTFKVHHYVSVDDFGVILLMGALLACAAMVCYGGWCFGTILKAVKSMAAGDLDRKIDTSRLYGSFRDCAENLNTVSQAAMVAARKQMQSERMKTELITNVSHDIKTPLTSIINYVDLLQQPHTEEEKAEYLEVLARQSQRLKKLTEDLVEMSKASTGNVTVELGMVDASETVLQALGEFGDKLEAVPLSVVFPQPPEPVMMRCDGRLAWRVMSNLLGNAVKYAMPGTRLYVSVERAEQQVIISFKNISRESLNISAGELMERFVRGDASRNTEGSGLGLNIAQSLMEVQGGALALTVDGDLFKVTLIFPAV